MRQCYRLPEAGAFRGRCLEPRELLARRGAELLSGRPRWGLIKSGGSDHQIGLWLQPLMLKVPTIFTLKFPLQNGVVKICYKLEFLWCNWKGGFGIDVSKVRGPLFPLADPTQKRHELVILLDWQLMIDFINQQKWGASTFWGNYMFCLFHMILCNYYFIYFELL